MDGTRSAQEESDEDNNSAPSPPPERNRATAGGGGGRDPDDLVVKPQRKKVYVHRCPFTHDCSHRCRDRNKGASDLPPNVPTDGSEALLFSSDPLKVRNPSCPSEGSDCAEYPRFLGSDRSAEPPTSVERDSVCMPVYNPEQRLVYLQRGLSKAAAGREVRRASLLSSFALSPSSESPFRRTYSTQSWPPCFGASPPPPIPLTSHRTFPEDNAGGPYPPPPPPPPPRVPSVASSTSQISRIRDTANLMASLGAPEGLRSLPYSFSQPLPPTAPPHNATASITSGFHSEGINQGAPSGRPTDAITPLFRQYCRHFFLETLCPGVTESEVRPVASAVESLEDRVFLDNAKSKITVTS
ncbi:uncharacterized protein LOC135209049 isoform X2 [Macrobrachium nipponense]|uniref:uncharacterized protein LOC135209049 isoform X2 n=1 Tax=Macrobrachium nipponense TaxID=159736 RepID=UPI0030C8C43B